uniref:NADH-ubiquinone oxidoreductase chain 2 n=1 Tax=Onthophagus clypeatus TaxID=206761 RepID=A0A1X9HEK7_9SCAR|nr:NADH deshydrogenase subunit 2 [Onthophagus clypeatus]
MFYFSLMLGTMIAVSSYSWMGMWIGMEINLLSIIPLLSNSKNPMSSEATMKYFITQTLASMILLLSLILMSMNMNYNMSSNSYLSIIFMSSLFMKMGAAPFHFWFPEIMGGLNWTNSFIMLTWQKIAPMMLISYNFDNNYFIAMIVILSSLISGIMGMNQTDLRKILAYSSINHISWMLLAMMFLETIWMYYFITYSFISLNIIIMLNKFNIFQLNQLFSSMNNYPLMKFFFILNFMSLGGLPPFLGFMPKWLTIQILIKMELFSLSFIVIIMTLITLFFYMRIITLGMTMNNNYNNIKNNYMKKFNFIYMINFIVLMSLLLITIIFNMY